MALKVLFAAPPEDWEEYRTTLAGALARAGLNAHLARDHAPQEVDYIVYAPDIHAPGGLELDFSAFPRCKAVLSLWAGIERIVRNPSLTQPLARMVDEGLRQGMIEWVTGHVLRHHLGMDAHIVNPRREWISRPPPLARDRPVTLLGLGALGRACAEMLVSLGFPVTGWSRSPRQVPGVRCLSGPQGLAPALRGAQIVVLLLPLTPQTKNVMNARHLALPAPGAVLLNAGRGRLIDDEALLAALETGQIGHATLDVFRTEPLPKDHPFWAHPRVTVTPHIASATRPETASDLIAENIRRSEAGEPLLNEVDRNRGY